MRTRALCSLALVSVLLWCCCFISTVVSQSGGGDAAVMQLLKKGITQMGNLDWSHPNPCKWDHVQCNSENRVTRIQIGNQNLQGTLPPELNTLNALQRLEVMRNQFSGPLPSLAGLNSLQVLLLHDNRFSSVPTNFFAGMSALQAVDLGNNPFSPWRIPDSLRDAASLQNFSASSANIVGPIPGFLGGSFPGLMGLHLSFNPLEGGLPSTFAGSSIQSLWLNNFKSDSKMSGTIELLQNMTMLREVWLHGNHFTGPLPDLSPVTELWSLSLRDNDFTGIVPASLVNIHSLRIVNLTNNHLQGSPPKFDTNVVQVDMNDNCNSFCLSQPGALCDPRINVLLSIAEAMSYPKVFAENWKGNDPCNGWPGITCFGGNITVVNFQGMGLAGTISPRFSEIKSLQILILSNNMLNGNLPAELVTLPNLNRLDVSHNNLDGQVPNFEQRVDVISQGNSFYPNLHTVAPGGVPSSSEAPSGNGSGLRKRASEIWVVGGSVCGVMFLGLIGVVGLSLYKRRKRRSCSPNALAIHPSHSDAVKVTVAASRVNGVGSETYSYSSSGLSDLHVVESGNNMVISLDGLRTVTDNFSDDNILGKGGFGTVYKGESPDGTKIAVKRMESGVITGTGLSEFTSEIAVLTKVRHRHLVSFLGYCLDENERLLVYEYMPQGTLSRYLFNWKEEELKPLEWMSRLSIALDVARGVEYLHGLAHQSFIHRDLKPSNILLGDDMRAKVADFGLVRLAPDGKASFATKLAGTFGYLAPEYAVTGRVTTKVDVFSFGVILMEMITGRQAIDETIPDDSQHLVTWFRRIHSRKESFGKAIDPTINLDKETLASISTVAELAGHCCARESHQRPDMGHVVNVLSTLVEFWKPADSEAEYGYGADLDTLLPDAVEKWRDSSVEECNIPIPASGFADTSQHQW